VEMILFFKVVIKRLQLNTLSHLSP